MSLTTHLKNSKELIDRYEKTQKEKYLIYSSIELRMCLESITYKVSKHYLNFMSEKQLKLYQAPQLMRILSEFEENIESDFILSVNFENLEKVFLGKHISLPKYKLLRKIYNKLGNYIHYSDKEKKIKLEFLKTTYETIKEIDNKNQIYGFFNNVISFTCSICNTKNKVTEYKLNNSEVINCLNPECKILLTHKKVSDKVYIFKPREPLMDCPCCENKIYFTTNPENINLMSTIQCNKCHSLFQITNFTVSKI